jgi:hypothetical protein
MARFIKSTLVIILLLLVFVGGVLVGNVYQLTDMLCPATAEPYILEQDLTTESGIIIPAGTVVPLRRCAYMQRFNYRFAIDKAVKLKPYSGTLDKSYGFAELQSIQTIDPFPDDVQSYIEDYELCLHWMGEEAYSRERGKEIMKGFYQYCETKPNIDQRKALLVEEYKDHPYIIDALNGHEDLLPALPGEQ